MHSIEELRELFLDELNKSRFTDAPAMLYEPNNYFLALGGKRLRPVLLLLTCELFDGDYRQAISAALAIEYFHNFTLIHDDIMDQAPLRRGKPTLHHLYSLNTAILCGDVLFVKAYEEMGKIAPEKFHAIFNLFTQTAKEVCEGQQYDLDFETQEDVSQDAYIEMIRLKTSVLIAASMKIGALIGNASPEDADLIYRYAENLGIAFQIQDDILDCFGDEKLVGKQPGGDIIQNKKTLLFIEALAKSKESNDNTLLSILQDTQIENTAKLNAVLAIFNQYKIKEFGLTQRELYIEKSKYCIEKLSLSSDKKDILLSLINHLVIRDF